MPVIAPHDQGDDQSDDQSDEPAQPLRMIFKPEVIQRVGHSFPTIWKWMRAGKFPLSFQIGSKTAWREDEVDQWLASRPRSSFKQA
jgi:predicted DNA-binding transcriptional regulator AlpA